MARNIRRALPLAAGSVVSSIESTCRFDRWRLLGDGDGA